MAPLVRGISRPTRPRSPTLARAVRRHHAGRAAARAPWHIVLGAELARLGVAWATRWRWSPGGQVTPAGVVPRLKQFTVAGTFEAGHYGYDSGLALIHLDDAARLFRVEGPDRRAAAPERRAPGAPHRRRLARQMLGPADGARLDAHQPQLVRRGADRERLMFIIPRALIVAVAAFNLVSTLVMTVTDKRRHRHPAHAGRQPASVMGIFVVQGAAAGVIGTLAGVLLGLLVALNIDIIVPAIEARLGVAFLPGSIYVISRMPSEPLASDIVPIAIIAVCCSPSSPRSTWSWRASASAWRR